MNRDYRQKTINGWLSDGDRFGGIPVTVRMTHDDKGASLSLTAGDTVQIGIPLEEVTDIIALVERMESDKPSCKTCKHYTAGEHDGSCGSYICKDMSDWEEQA